VTSVLPSLRTTRVTWVTVEKGFHVASRAGEFVGFVEQTSDGHFVGFDGRSTPVGRYESLDEAQRAVQQVPAEEPAISPRAEGAFRAAASVSGLVAVGTLAAAVMMLPGV